MGSIGAWACFCERRMAALRSPACTGSAGWAGPPTQARATAAPRRCGGAAVRRWGARRLLPRGLREQLRGGRGAAVVVGEEEHGALELREEGGLAWGGGGRRLGASRCSTALVAPPPGGPAALASQRARADRLAWAPSSGRLRSAAAAARRPQGESSRLWGSPERVRGASGSSGRRRMGCGEGERPVTRPARPRREERAPPGRRRARPLRLRYG